MGGLPDHWNAAHTQHKHFALPVGLNQIDTKPGVFNVDGAKGGLISVYKITLPKGYRFFFQIQSKFFCNIWIYFHMKNCGLMQLPDVTTCQYIEILLFASPYLSGTCDRGWITILILFSLNKTILSSFASRYHYLNNLYQRRSAYTLVVV